MVVIVRRQTAIRARSVVSAVGCIRITFIESLSSAICPPAKLVARLVWIEVCLSTRRKIAARECGYEPLPGDVRPALVLGTLGFPYSVLPLALQRRFFLAQPRGLEVFLLLPFALLPLQA